MTSCLHPKAAFEINKEYLAEKKGFERTWRKYRVGLAVGQEHAEGAFNEDVLVRLSDKEHGVFKSGLWSKSKRSLLRHKLQENSRVRNTQRGRKRSGTKTPPYVYI